MKRILALFLTAVLLCCSLSGCVVYYSLFGINENYTGPLVYAYFSDLPTTFDPLYAYLDDSATFIMSLIYEGLYKYDPEGKVVKGMAKSYEKTLWNTDTGEFQIEITIKNSRWSDQTSVSADQFVYAWRRILDPGIATQAAVLLYDIKNAQKVKNAENDLTKFDFGATAVGTDVLRIDLETTQLEDGSYKEPDLDAFFEKLASPLLVPVRSDAVTKFTDWGSTNATVIANGPFYLKSFTPGGTVRLERNRFYRRNLELDPINKYVEPYGFVISTASADMGKDETGKDIILQSYPSAADRALQKYLAGEVDYLSYLPINVREQYKDQVSIYDTLFTHTYYFNTENPLFAKAEVRQALSLAVDRSALANRLVFAKAATSIVNDLTFENGYSKSKDYFNAHSEKSISASADMQKAKSLLSSAGVKGGSFTITIKDGDETGKTVAEYCESVWEELGFDVSIRTLGTCSYQENFYDGVVDLFNECFKAGGKDFSVDLTDKINYTGIPGQVFEGFDVIAVDAYQSSTDAFTTLAPFSKYFSGGFIDLSVVQGDYEPVLPVTGYDSEAFNAAINAAFTASDDTERSAKLHDAEKILMTDLPVMPLITYQFPVLKISNLKKISYGFGGSPIFLDLKYSDYKERETE